MSARLVLGDLRRQRHTHPPQEAPLFTNIPCISYLTIVYERSACDAEGQFTTPGFVIPFKIQLAPIFTVDQSTPSIRSQCPPSSRKRLKCSQISRKPYAERKKVRTSCKFSFYRWERPALTFLHTHSSLFPTHLRRLESRKQTQEGRKSCSHRLPSQHKWPRTI